MTQLETLEQLAYDAGIAVSDIALESCPSLLIQRGDRRRIVIDSAQVESNSGKTVLIAHELGHFFASAFHGAGATPVQLRKCERSAWKWAIRVLLPQDRLEAALRESEDDLALVAQDFGVSEAFVRTACTFYWGIEFDT